MGSKYTKRYSDEYKRDAIELVRSSGRTVTEVARELGVSSESLRGWVKRDRAAQETGPGAGPGVTRLRRSPASRPTRHACAIGKIRPSRHNNTVSKITEKLQCHMCAASTKALPSVGRKGL
ncbi:transposase [Streptomyces sp. NPDC006999]|uniref:transposase n=1 Tax=unclassified Streptomyces TaxID=2593676 RepID=UPI00073AEA59|nr:Transposase [Streptomyces sp. AVP053U2]